MEEVERRGRRFESPSSQDFLFSGHFFLQLLKMRMTTFTPKIASVPFSHCDDLSEQFVGPKSCPSSML